MDRQKYRVVFSGRIESGKTVDSVKEQLITIFKIDREKAERLFSGQTRVILKESDLDACEKLQKKLWRAGAISTIQPEYSSDQPITEPSVNQVSEAADQQLQEAKNMLQALDAQKTKDKTTVLKNKYAIVWGAAALLLVAVLLFFFSR